MRKVLLFGVLLIVIPLIIWSFGGRQDAKTAGVTGLASTATPSPVAKSDSGEGGVTVTAQPVITGGEDIIFEFTIDTHSGDLTDFPVLEKVSLVSGDREVLPKEWRETASSGHHRAGKLVFKVGEIPRQARDTVGELELVIRDLGGIPERKLEWTR